MQSTSELLDLVIIGAAAAGCTAAVYAARRNLNVIIVTKDIGGEVALSGEVENWPGMIHTNGFTLAKNFHEHVQSYNVPIHEGLTVTAITQEKNYHIVHTKNYHGEEIVFKTKTVIIGSGIHPRVIGVPGEDHLRGKGVTYCTVCDGPLYRNKITTTIGAGNSALESALMMADLAKKVYVLTKFANTPETRGGFPKGEDILIKKLKAKENVEIFYQANTTEILGDHMVNGVTYIDMQTQEKKTLETNGVMIHIGMIPNSAFVDWAPKNAAGEIIVNKFGETNRPGVFAAGDVTDLPYKQISIAAGQGATAALRAIEYINMWEAE